MITSSPWFGNTQKMILSGGIHEEKWIALLVSAQLLENRKPFLEAAGNNGLACRSCSIMAKECTAREAELPSCPSGSCCQVVAKACWQERVGKVCTAAACSQSRANASAGCVQPPPPVANLLKWFNHPILTYNLCCHGGVHPISFSEQQTGLR